MIIGFCGEGFPDARRALRVALPDAELVEVPDSGDSASSRPPRVDVLVPGGASVDADLMDATRPRLIQQFGVGLQSVDLDAAHDRGIPVANVPAGGTGNATAVAEIAMLHLLMLLRRYPEARRSAAERRLGQPPGVTLAGKSVTVLGVGAIGTGVISRLAAFGAVPYGVSRRTYDDYPGLAGLLPAERYQPIGGLTRALAHSHALIVCCPLTEQTRGLIGAEALAAMPAGGIVINVARGPIVDYRALLDALRGGHLSGAGIDVAWDEPIDPDDPLLRENVTCTPHIGGVTRESYSAIADAFAVNVRNLESGAALDHRAD